MINCSRIKHIQQTGWDDNTWDELHVYVIDGGYYEKQARINADISTLARSEEWRLSRLVDLPEARSKELLFTQKQVK